MNTKTAPRFLLLAYLLFLGLHFVPAVAGGRMLWGVSQWGYFSRATAFVLLAVGLLPLAGFARARIDGAASGVASLGIVKRIGSRPWVKYALALVLAAVLLYVLRQRTHFLGDGYLWASRMGSGTLFSYMRPLSSSLYQIAYLAAGLFGAPNATRPFEAAAAVSVMSGLVFLVFAWKTAWSLGAQSAERAFILLAILSSGSIALFFGYVEAYAPAAAGLMAFIYFGVRYAERRESPHFLAVIFLIMVSLHLSLVALLPSLIVLIAARGREERVRRRCTIAYAAAIAIGMTALWIAREQRLFAGFFAETFLPFFSATRTGRAAYPLVSARHLFDFLNEILLISPIVVLSVVGLYRSGREMDTSGWEAAIRCREADTRRPETDNHRRTVMLFLGSIILFYGVEYLLFNKVLGAARDWDLFSPLGVAVSLYVALFLLDRFGEMPRVLATLGLFVFALHNGPWIAINASAGRSTSRFVDLAETGYWSDYARGYAYETLAKHFGNRNDRPQAVGYFRAALEADPANKRYKRELVQIFAESEQYDQALKYCAELVAQEPGSPELLSSLGILYGKTSQFDQAEKTFQEAIRADSTYAPAYENLAVLYVQTNRMELAIAALEKCIASAPATPRLYRTLGALYERVGDTAKARMCFEKAGGLNER